MRVIRFDSCLLTRQVRSQNGKETAARINLYNWPLKGQYPPAAGKITNYNFRRYLIKTIEIPANIWYIYSREKE